MSEENNDFNNSIGIGCDKNGNIIVVTKLAETSSMSSANIQNCAINPTRSSIEILYPSFSST